MGTFFLSPHPRPLSNLDLTPNPSPNGEENPSPGTPRQMARGALTPNCNYQLKTMIISTQLLRVPSLRKACEQIVDKMGFSGKTIFTEAKFSIFGLLPEAQFFGALFTK